MKILTTIYGTMFVTLHMFGAGLVNGTLSPVPGVGSGLTSNQIYQLIQDTAPTNGGQTANQVSVLINDTNVNRIQPVVDAKLAITNQYAKTNVPIIFNPTNRFSSTLTNSFNNYVGKLLADYYIGTTNVGRIEAGHAGNIFNISRDDTLGYLFWGLDDTSSISDTNPKQLLGGFDGYGDWYVKQRLYVGGTQLIFNTDNDAPNVTIETSQSGAELSFERPPTMSGAHISAGTIPMSALNTNVLTVTNQPFTIGQAVVITGTNTSGQPVVKGTNWPTGGGGGNFSTNSSGLAQFLFVEINTNTSTGISYWRYAATTGIGEGEVLADGKTGVPGSASLLASNVVATGQILTSNSVTALGGSVSLIPTNAAPVYTSNGLTGSLPFGLTNTLQGRVQYLVGYYIIDAVGGNPILTVSNELDGYKYPPIALGASSSIAPETNWFTTPILSSNTVLRVRDESTGTGASVGLVSSRQIGN